MTADWKLACAGPGNSRQLAAFFTTLRLPGRRTSITVVFHGGIGYWPRANAQGSNPFLTTSLTPTGRFFGSARLSALWTPGSPPRVIAGWGDRL